jgi:hypothetical protein
MPSTVETRSASLGAAKLAQAQSLLAEHDVDAWLTVVRESSQRPDPMLHYFLDVEFTWTTFFLVTERGSTALVATFDAPDVAKAGVFDEVRTYKEGPKAALLGILDAAKPRDSATISSPRSRERPTRGVSRRRGSSSRISGRSSSRRSAGGSNARSSRPKGSSTACAMRSRSG